MSVIVKHIPHTVDLNEPIKKVYIDTLLATGNNMAHCFDIALVKEGQAVTMPSGAAVTAYLIRYGDNATVPITNGTVSGNVVSVTLTKACYNKAGQVAIIINVTADGVTNTVFYGEGTIFTGSTDTVVNDENIVPTLSDLLAQIAAMEAGTAAANTATNRANAAANRCEQMQIDASGMAGDSNKLGGRPPEAYTAVNLLDNSDFTNPVYQAGLGGKHGNTMYAVDRWVYNKNDASHLSLNYGLGLSFAAGISAVLYQRLANVNIKDGKTYTLALWTADGGQYALVVQQYHTNIGTSGYTACHNNENVIYIQNVSATQPIKCVALYEGTYTAEALPPYRPKGYAAELAECQRYYENSWYGLSKTETCQHMGVAFSTEKFDATIHFNQEKHTKPTMIFHPSGSHNAIKAYINLDYRDVTVEYYYRLGMKGIIARVIPTNQTLTNGYSYQFHAHWEACADL